MVVFEDEEGHSIKFFIQKGIPEEEHIALVQAIEEEGGKVEAKVPIKGYVLVQPHTAEAERLRDCWMKQDRPDRHFVPLTWVNACKANGRLLRQIFLRSNKPLKIHIHKSIANLVTRDFMSGQIYNSGGELTDSEEDADVIIADPDTDVYQQLTRKYQADASKHIESHLWVKNCVERGICVHTVTAYKNPGGRRAGDERTSFTDEDEMNLCQWIATVIPYKESGGRTGNKIYQELCSHANMPGYEWVSRHTWQSWRERYKKNAVRLDAHIAAIVDAVQTLKAAKGPYAFTKQLESKPKRKRRTKKEMEEAAAAPTVNEERSVQINVGTFGNESEGDHEWDIRIGNDPTPAWKKRKYEDDAAVIVSEALKRMRSDTYGDVPHVIVGEKVHLVDQALQDIANEFQFLIGEVRTFYDKTGDMNATRDRFARMRELLDTMND